MFMITRLQSMFTNLFFDPSPYSSTSTSKPSVAIFAAGNFWSTEHMFLEHFPPSKGKGILRTTVGYTGGKDSAIFPDHRTVLSGETRHAMAVRIEFDEEKLGYAELVEFFYRMHDPTTLNAQGGDTGTQYRSAIIFAALEHYDIVREVTERVEAEHFTPQGEKIVTEIRDKAQTAWWDAEEYHQLYLYKYPNGYRCPTHRLHWYE